MREQSGGYFHSVADKFAGPKGFVPFGGRGQRLSLSSALSRKALKEQLGDLGGAGDLSLVTGSSSSAAGSSSAEPVRQPDPPYCEQLLPATDVVHEWAVEHIQNVDFIRKDLDRIDAVHEIFSSWLFNIDEKEPINDQVRALIAGFLATFTIWMTHYESIMTDVLEKGIYHDLTDTMNELQQRAIEAEEHCQHLKERVAPYLQAEDSSPELRLKRRKTEEEASQENVPENLELELFGSVNVE